MVTRYTSISGKEADVNQGLYSTNPIYKSVVDRGAVATPTTPAPVATSRETRDATKDAAQRASAQAVYNKPDRSEASLALAEKARLDATSSESKAEIQRQAEQNAARVRQAQIDAINSLYAPRYAEMEAGATARDARSRALALRTGQMGSGEQPYQVAEGKKMSAEERAALDNEKQAKIELAFGNYDQMKVAEAERLTKEATASAEEKVKYYQDLTDKALTTVKSFGAAGVTLDDLKTKDPDTYQSLKDIGGMSDFEISSALAEGNPALNAKIEYQDGVAYIAYVNPTTGKMEIQTKQVGDLAKDEKFQSIDGVGYAIKTNTDGTISARPLTKKATTTGTGSGLGGIYDQLDYRTANAVISQGDKFGASDVVKKYNNIIAASNLIAGVDPNSKNPAEHQAVVYNFAKALDPDSVVREGEYNTVKKYSQSLFNKYRGEITQALAGTGFLSAKAIADIQGATKNRIDAYTPQYANLRKETANRINTIAGKNVADMVLLDYEAGYQPGGDQYSSLRAQVGPGEILIKRNGQVGAVPSAEFNPATDEKL